jgi:hypothetical protein
MMLIRRQAHFAFLILVVFALLTMPAAAQGNNDTGKLKIHVSPKQAYVFVDGQAIRDGSQTIDLPAGAHQVSVRNSEHTTGTH